MACTGRAWCDFVSFDPRMPGDMQLWVKRVPCDPAFMSEMEERFRPSCRTRPETGRADRALRGGPHDPLPRPKEASALTLLRNAFAQGWTNEAMMVDFAAAALGEENRALVQRVWDRHFKIMGAV